MGWATPKGNVAKRKMKHPSDMTTFRSELGWSRSVANHPTSKTRKAASVYTGKSFKNSYEFSSCTKQIIRLYNTTNAKMQEYSELFRISFYAHGWLHLIINILLNKINIFKLPSDRNQCLHYKSSWTKLSRALLHKILMIYHGSNLCFLNTKDV